MFFWMNFLFFNLIPFFDFFGLFFKSFLISIFSSNIGRYGIVTVHNSRFPILETSTMVIIMPSPAALIGLAWNKFVEARRDEALQPYSL